jgi:hypothetical protein
MSSTSRNRTPRASARSVARWITGPSAMGSEKGHTQLDQVGASGDHAMHQRHRHIRRWITGGDEWDQRGASLGPQPLEHALDTAHSLIPSRWATVCMSLSPRPERLMTMLWSRRMVGASLFA